MQLLKNYKTLKGSSLIESVMAISIISVCSLVAFMVYLNVVKQHKTVGYYKAKHEVELLIKDIESNHNYDNDAFSFMGYHIDKKVFINKNEGTVLIEFSIRTGEKKHIINKLIPYEQI